MIKVKIKEVLDKQGKTAFWLAKEAKLGYSCLKKLVDEDAAAVSFKNLSLICDVLKCDITDVLEYIKDKE